MIKDIDIIAALPLKYRLSYPKNFTLKQKRTIRKIFNINKEKIECEILKKTNEFLVVGNL